MAEAEIKSKFTFTFKGQILEIFGPEVTFTAIGTSSDRSTGNLSQTPFFPCSKMTSDYVSQNFKMLYLQHKFLLCQILIEG